MTNAVAERAAKPRKVRQPKPVAEEPSGTLELRWELAALPSSQHKAGLAGLALCVEHLSRKPNLKGACRVSNLDEGSLTLTVDADGMQELFDLIYDASLEEVSSKSKWKGAEPKRVEIVHTPDERSGKVKTKELFVYDRVLPRGGLIDEWDRCCEGEPKIWLKLWRDLVWSVLRGVPATREPFNARAEGRTCPDGRDTWSSLAKSAGKGVDLPSTYAIGAQAKSADDVSIRDIEKNRLLLHFWPYVVSIYVPSLLERDGKLRFAGFALAVPEVASLASFIEDWQVVMRSRQNSVLAYIPKEAVVSIAGEGGLDVFRRATQIVRQREDSKATSDLISAVDVFHVERDGNNVRVRDLARIFPDAQRDAVYERIRDNYWSPPFRRQRVANLIEDKPWWHGFGRLCATTPEEMTIKNQTFRHDTKAAMTEIEMNMETSNNQPTLEQLIYKRVQAYVLGKTERKHELSWAKVQGNPGQEKEYREKREKVSREAFLAVRSRTGSDFVWYFTSTICSIPQHANEESYAQIARALMDPSQTEKVRSLTLLALSAVA